MKDIDKIKNLLDGFKIGYYIEERDLYTCVVLEEGKEKVNGYTGFISTYFFDKEGKFVEVKNWE